jgi:hypothetical protein
MRHRFHSICPYFAMFPESFAERWISSCSEPGQVVLDPFAGRGTAPFQAVLMGRRGIASDVNPVAFVLSGAKVDSPEKASVQKRLRQLERYFLSHRLPADTGESSPFFDRAFYPSTLAQVRFLRSSLNWQKSRVDRFIAALALGSLHGEMDKSKSYFSNQMPRTISTKPGYSINFWTKRDLWAEPRDVFAILRQRLEYRFASPRPVDRGRVFLSDIRDLSRIAPDLRSSVDLLITSPPYLNVTNFEEDQWLRLWFLGGCPYPHSGRYSRDDRYERPEKYWAFLCDAWRAARPLLKQRSTIACRIGGIGLSETTLESALSASMQFLARRWRLVSQEVSYFPRRQTDAFHPGTIGCRFEVDFCFELRQ